jgi:hypothetical protein
MTDVVQEASTEDELAAQMSPDEDGDVHEPEPQPEDDPPAEPEDEPELRVPSTFQVTKELADKVDRESKRHENALAKLYGEEWVHYNLCALCLGDGFLLPAPADVMPEEQWFAVTAQAGKMGERPLKTATYARVCDECDGWGQVLTGAKNDTQLALPCKRCDGRGWFDTELHQPPAMPAAPVVTTTSGLVFPNFHQSAPDPAAAANVEQAPVGWYDSDKAGGDKWGRWPGHSRYGIDPANAGGLW